MSEKFSCSVTRKNGVLIMKMKSAEIEELMKGWSKNRIQSYECPHVDDGSLKIYATDNIPISTGVWGRVSAPIYADKKFNVSYFAAHGLSQGVEFKLLTPMSEDMVKRMMEAAKVTALELFRTWTKPIDISWTIREEDITGSVG